MRIIWHMHSCFEINDRSTVVMDPHDGRSIGVKPPSLRADIVTISHDHFDHNAVRVIKGEYVLVKDIAPRTVKGVAIRGITGFHDDVNGEKRGKMNIFHLTMDGVRFCHLGDLGHMLTDAHIKELGEVDVLFLPVGGVFTIDGAQAQTLVRAINPRVAIPMHFRVGGLSMSIQNADGFLKGLPEEKVVRVGNEVEFEAEDLPEETEYWVFSQ
ncbi:MAG TPA: MBL fold metallo-hydrolase [Methanomassiliicoccales archaeon]|nr:MBL fold metallo-hydrolase [Methanomassiliicoccales archaeon]HPR97947.1 MBL fold metallo-hydrolase [Methanomassiliicoccales archaeon]